MKVEIKKDKVIIGEGKNKTRLNPKAWNKLVDIVKSGKLKKI